jgi:alkanesulfonate monooxygenase SsuD/methylene tetrahydromethanopterin reductase-like flavin-dependent oxidoreductase (luciferase family)
MPNHASVEEIRQGRETLNRLAKEAGRDPSTIQVMAFGMSGQYRDREAIKDLEQAGVSRVTIWLDDTEKPGALREIEEIARQVLD